MRRHLCPLDLADDLPALAFGRSRIAQFSPEELAVLFDAPRLAQFHWLVVEEQIELDQPPEARAVPVLFMDKAMREGHYIRAT